MANIGRNRRHYTGRKSLKLEVRINRKIRKPTAALWACKLLKPIYAWEGFDVWRAKHCYNEVSLVSCFSACIEREL